MTDKEIIIAIRAEIERLMAEVMKFYETACKDGDEEVSISPMVYARLQMLLSFINSLQEEPVSRTSADIEAVMQEVEEKSKVFTEAHQGEDADTILAAMRGVDSVSDELKEFAEEWDESLYRSDAVIAGAKWHKQQMIKSAKLDGWIARDENGRLHIFEVEPYRISHRWWDRDYQSAALDNKDFPELKWEDEPIYVKLAIIKEDRI